MSTNTQPPILEGCAVLPPMHQGNGSPRRHQGDTFGTLLSAAGVAPRTAQAAMRHSTIDLTMNVYTDPKLLDVVGAMELLPALPLGDGRQTAANVLSATGTDDLPTSPLAPMLAPTTGKTGTLQSIMDKIASAAEESSDAEAVDVSAYQVKRKDLLTIAVSRSCVVEPKGIEPSTSWMQTCLPPVISEDSKELTTLIFSVCTSVCTSDTTLANAEVNKADRGNQGISQSDQITQLAAELASLSLADKAKLIAILLGADEKGKGGAQRPGFW